MNLFSLSVEILIAYYFYSFTFDNTNMSPKLDNSILTQIFGACKFIVCLLKIIHNNSKNKKCFLNIGTTLILFLSVGGVVQVIESWDQDIFPRAQ